MIRLNGQQILPDIFPDKTSQVWKLDEKILRGRKFLINWEFSHEAELIHLAQLTHLLRSIDIHKEIDLYIDYLPYARQDKDILNNATFALHTFSYMLNICGVNRVIIQDPHSLKALELIDNSEAIYPQDKIKKIITELGINLVCYPDKGATIKYKEVYDFVEYCDTITGDKVRDQSTGYITSYEIIQDKGDCHKYIKYRDILIVDDLCDGGATFIILAKELYSRGAKSVSLFVTHGIFSKGLNSLKEAGIDRIFTAKGEAVDMGDNVVGYKEFKENYG